MFAYLDAVFVEKLYPDDFDASDVFFAERPQVIGIFPRPCAGHDFRVKKGEDLQCRCWSFGCQDQQFETEDLMHTQ